MLNKIIYYSLHNRLVILVCALLLMIGGTYTAFHTDVDVFPDLTAPSVVVMTEANGMAPEEVERLVTFPVETAVNGATHVRRVRSSSTTGFSVVWVEFDWGTDIYLARQIVSERLATVRENLPEQVETEMAPIVSVTGEIMVLALQGDKTADPLEVRRVGEFELRNRLLAIPGVGQVTVLGGRLPEYQVAYDPEKMRQAGVSFADLKNTVEAAQSSIPAG